MLMTLYIFVVIFDLIYYLSTIEAWESETEASLLYSCSSQLCISLPGE